MDRAVRGTALAGWAVLGVISLMLAGSAWACVPQARLVTLEPGSSGPVGSEVTVEGLAFDPGTVEIRWDASDGPVLGRANGPSFSAKVTIPEATEGLHAIVVLGRSPDGSIGNAATAAFQVAPAGGEGPAAAPAAAPADDAGSLGDEGDDGDSVDAGAVALGAAGGAGLVLVGGLGGAALRRRPRPSAE